MDAFEQFIHQYPLLSFKKGETILLKNDIPPGVYIIETGLVKTYSINNNGLERLVSIDRKGETFPIGFAVGLIEKTEYFYEAFTKCNIRVVPREAYLLHLNNNIESMYRQQIRITALLLSTLSRVNALEQSTSGDKIALTLLYMASRVGVMLRPYTTRLTISVTQQEIANSLGLTRETTSIELKKLETLHLISHSRKNYILYMERLNKYMSEERHKGKD